MMVFDLSQLDSPEKRVKGLRAADGAMVELLQRLVQGQEELIHRLGLLCEDAQARQRTELIGLALQALDPEARITDRAAFVESFLANDMPEFVRGVSEALRVKQEAVGLKQEKIRAAADEVIARHVVDGVCGACGRRMVNGDEHAEDCAAVREVLAVVDSIAGE